MSACQPNANGLVLPFGEHLCWWCLLELLELLESWKIPSTSMVSKLGDSFSWHCLYSRGDLFFPWRPTRVCLNYILPISPLVNQRSFSLFEWCHRQWQKSPGEEGKKHHFGMGAQQKQLHQASQIRLDLLRHVGAVWHPLMIIQHYSTMFIFITSRAHFRRSVDIFFILRTMLTGVKLLMSLPQKRQRRYTESGALLNWVPDLS